MSGYSSSPVFTNVNLSGNVATNGGLYLYSGTPTVTYGNAYDNSPDTYDDFTDPTGGRRRASRVHWEPLRFRCVGVRTGGKSGECQLRILFDAFSVIYA